MFQDMKRRQVIELLALGQGVNIAECNLEVVKFLGDCDRRRGNLNPGYGSIFDLGLIEKLPYAGPYIKQATAACMPPHFLHATRPEFLPSLEIFQPPIILVLL